MDVLIWMIKPIRPHNELLIGLAKEIEEQRGWHIPEDDPLRIKKQKDMQEAMIRTLIPTSPKQGNNYYLKALQVPQTNGTTTVIMKTTKKNIDLNP